MAKVNKHTTLHIGQFRLRFLYDIKNPKQIHNGFSYLKSHHGIYLPYNIHHSDFSRNNHNAARSQNFQDYGQHSPHEKFIHSSLDFISAHNPLCSGLLLFSDQVF